MKIHGSVEDVSSLPCCSASTGAMPTIPGYLPVPLGWHRLRQPPSACHHPSLVCMPPPFTGGCSHKTTSVVQLQNMARSHQSPNADQHCSYTCLSIFIVVFVLGILFSPCNGRHLRGQKISAVNELTDGACSLEWKLYIRMTQQGMNQPKDAVLLLSQYSSASFGTLFTLSLLPLTLPFSSLHSCSTPLLVSTCFYCLGTLLVLVLWLLVLVFTVLVLLSLSVLVFTVLVLLSLSVLVFTVLVLLSLSVLVFFYFGTHLSVSTCFFLLWYSSLCQYLFWLLWYSSLCQYLFWLLWYSSLH